MIPSLHPKPQTLPTLLLLTRPALLLRGDEYDDDDWCEFKEYVVSVRARNAGADQVSDWVPSAILGLMWRGGNVDDNPILKGIADHSLAVKPALKTMRREVRYLQLLQQSSLLSSKTIQTIEYIAVQK